MLGIILKIIIYYLFILFYFMVSQNKNLKDFKLLDLITFTLEMFFMINSFINNNITFFETIIFLLIILFLTLLIENKLQNRLVITYYDKSSVKSDNIIEIISKLKIKTIKKILQRYNL